MKEYYELGKIAALNELVNSARKGNELAIKVASAIPAEYNNIPREVIEASVEYGEKVAADWNKIQAGVKGAWEGVKKAPKATWEGAKKAPKATWEGIKKTPAALKSFAKEVGSTPGEIKALLKNPKGKPHSLTTPERDALVKKLKTKGYIAAGTAAGLSAAGGTAYALSGKKKSKKK